MNVEFIYNICEAYVLDNELSECQTDILSEQIVSEIRNLRETNFELYDYLYSLSKLNQQKVLSEYLDLLYLNKCRPESTEVIEEIAIELSLVALLGAGLATYYNKEFANFTFKLLNSLGEKLDRFGKFISTKGRKWGFDYAIIQKNTQDCYKKCGVEDSLKYRGADINASAYFGVSGKHKSLPAETSVQVECLRRCYLSHVVDVITLAMKSYFMCLKSAGQFDGIKGLNYNELISIPTGIVIGNNICYNYYTAAKEIMDKFIHLLDYIFKDSNEDKQKFMDELRKNLSNTRDEVDRRPIQSQDTNKNTNFIKDHKQSFNKNFVRR